MTWYYLSIDDTDTLDTVGTGHVLNDFLERLPFQSSFISRHQLFVHESVPYTSHNSAMCTKLEADISQGELVRCAADYLAYRFVPGSDPGLCVASCDELEMPQSLVEWGLRAKTQRLEKEDAYALAQSCHVHLSEHGGTGQGVIGALAAVGLRIFGSDGRVRGRRTVQPGIMTVGDLLAQTGFDRVARCDGALVPAEELVDVGTGDIKAVLQDGCCTVLAEAGDNAYILLSKEELKRY